MCNTADYAPEKVMFEYFSGKKKKKKKAKGDLRQKV